jgi:hypothetical protein
MVAIDQFLEGILQFSGLFFSLLTDIHLIFGTIALPYQDTAQV